MKSATLDAGHVMTTPGKQTPPFENGKIIKECEQNYPVMFEVERQLQYNNIKIDVTNRDIEKDLADTPNSSLASRINYEKTLRNDIAVSIHANATAKYAWNNTTGTETWCYAPNTNSQRLAKCIQKSIIDMTGNKDRGVKYCDANGDGDTNDPGDFRLAWVRDTRATAVLVELSFMTNKEDANDMLNPACHYLYGCAIARGICNYFGMAYDKMPKEEAEIRQNPSDELIKDEAEKLREDKLDNPQGWNEFRNTIVKIAETGSIKAEDFEKLKIGKDFDLYTVKISK